MTTKEQSYDWEEVLNRYERSGLGVLAFCEAEGIPKSGFYQARKARGMVRARRKGKPPEAGFVQVSSCPAEPVPEKSFSIELSLPHGITLRIR